MHIGFKPAGRRAAALAAVAALTLLAWPVASASALTGGNSFSYETASSAAIGPSSADAATIVDNVIISGSVTGNQFVSFFICSSSDPTSCSSTPFATAKLYSSTNGGNQTACSTNKGSNKAVCTATVTVLGNELTGGFNDIQARFPGDQFITPTTADVSLYQGPEASCTLSVTTTCLDSNTATDGTSSAKFSSNSPNTGNEQVVLAFGPQTIGCTGAGPSASSDSSDLLAYNVSNSGGINQLSYTIYGTAATAIDTAYPAGLVCYEAPVQFTAVNFPRTNPTVPETCTEASAPCSPATQQVTTDPSTGNSFGLGLWYGYLPNCSFASKRATTPTLLPCILSVTYKSPAGSKPASYTQVIDTSQSDPLVHSH